MNREKVLVVGGAGYFGRILVDDLLQYSRCDVVVASRQTLRSDRFDTVQADLWDPASLERALAGVKIAICAAGPFQKLPTSLVQLCLLHGIHYIDLADDRGFVHKVRSLVEEKAIGASAVCTAWSTVSAVSALLVRIGSAGMTHIDSIYIHMAPGNRGARQTATISSLMHSVGSTFAIFRNGAWHNVPGWSEPRDFLFPPPVGVRRGYLVDVPDHELFPTLFPAQTVEFRAGSELRILNACISLLRTTGRNWVEWSGVLQRAAALSSWIGHDSGAVGVEIWGSSKRRVSIVADAAGERIAAMPASVMVSLLLSGVEFRGLVSPADWLSRDDLQSECGKRNFRLIVEEL